MAKFKPANPQLGDRHNTDKPKLSLVLEAKHALEGCARALMYGLKKYSRGNWRKGFEHTSTMDSASRHLSAYAAGEDIDKESGLPHVDLALCNLVFLSEMYHTRKDLDDRPIKTITVLKSSARGKTEADGKKKTNLVRRGTKPTNPVHTRNTKKRS